MAKKTTRRHPSGVADHQASIAAFNLFGENDDAAIEKWTPPPSRPKLDHVVHYEYAGPHVTPKADMDELWGAIERFAEADPTPSPWRPRGTQFVTKL